MMVFHFLKSSEHHTLWYNLAVLTNATVHTALVWTVERPRRILRYTRTIFHHNRTVIFVSAVVAVARGWLEPSPGSGPLPHIHHNQQLPYACVKRNSSYKPTSDKCSISFRRLYLIIWNGGFFMRLCFFLFY